MSDISSVSSSSLAVSYNSSTSSASSTQAAAPHQHHHHGGGEKMMGDVTAALSSLGVNLDPSNSSTKSTLSSFMHSLMGALRGNGGGKGDNDNDGDEQGVAQPAQLSSSTGSAGSNPLKQGLDTLIASLNSGSSSDPALAKLQEQFNGLMGTTGQGNNKTSLQDFLGAFENQLTQEPPSNGYMVNTTA
ncbi:hypothetical protein [Aeromonas sp. MdU4]|uniref:hypothetical protein n=1 Tax=Aeromonas sp. MdU4 TaxID=3342819 RepID=UPI0035B98818